MNTPVVWRPVLGYEGFYSVSSIGEVRAEPRVVKHFSGSPKLLKEKVRKLALNTNGYMTVVLSKEGISCRHSVHRLVLLAFVGVTATKMDACHNNGNRTDNRLSNLRWDTRKGNMSDTISHGTRYLAERVVTRKLSKNDVVHIRSDHRSQIEIAANYGVTQSTISLIQAKKRWASLT